MSDYVIVKLYEDQTWTLAPDAAQVDDPEVLWRRDDRGIFRYVRLPSSLWVNIQEVENFRRDGFMPAWAKEAELLIRYMVAALLRRH